MDLTNSCEDLVNFLKRLHNSWLYKYSGEYPHNRQDMTIKPSILRDLFTLMHQKETNAKSKFGELEKMKKSQLWHINLRHFSLSLVQSLTEEGVMRPDEFMEPITVQVWLATNIISHLKPLAELAKHLSDEETRLNDNPMIYFIVSLPSVLDISLKQVVFLSLMRLKDTINTLKANVQKEIKKMDKFSRGGVDERGAEEGEAPLLKISGVVGVDKLCVSLQLPLDLHKSTSTQTESFISDVTARISHSSTSNNEETAVRTSLYSVDEDMRCDDNHSIFTSSLSSDGGELDRDSISLSSSQMNVFERTDMTIDQLQLKKPDFLNESFLLSFGQNIAVSAKHSAPAFKHSAPPVKRVLSVVDLLSTVNTTNDVITNGQVLENDDVLTHVLRIHVTNIVAFPEIVGEMVKVKGGVTKLSFAEEPIKVKEFVDHWNAPRKYAKYLKNFPTSDPRDEPVIKFVTEIGSHVEEEYSEYSPPPSLSVDAHVRELSGAIYAAHIKNIKGVVKDDVTASPTTIPISLNIQNLNINLAELPGSPDTDTLIGIESLQLIRTPDYKLSIIDSTHTQLPTTQGIQMQFRDSVLSDDLRDEDTPLPQAEDLPNSFHDTSIVSSQSDFTEIDALPEYTQAVLEELKDIKQKYEITSALNHNMQMELEESRVKMSSNKEVFTKTFSDVQSLANKNANLSKQLGTVEDRNRDLENEIADLKISKKSVENLLKSKVENIEESKNKSNVYLTEISKLKDTITGLRLNKESLMEILERNSEEIRLLTLKNHDLESPDD